MASEKSTVCHGVKATVFDPDNLTFDVVFQAAYFKGWGDVVRVLVKNAKDDTLRDEKVFWHLLLEVNGGGRLWSVCHYDDVMGVVGLASEKDAS